MLWRGHIGRTSWLMNVSWGYREKRVKIKCKISNPDENLFLNETKRLHGKCGCIVSLPNRFSNTNSKERAEVMDPVRNPGEKSVQGTRSERSHWHQTSILHWLLGNRKFGEENILRKFSTKGANSTLEQEEMKRISESNIVHPIFPVFFTEVKIP